MRHSRSCMRTPSDFCALAAQLSIAAICLQVAACSSTNVRSCSAMQVFSRSERDAEHVSRPMREERVCFAERLSTSRCSPDDIYSLPDGTDLYRAGPHCWVTPERGGALCTAESLTDLMRNCDVESLSLVAPWSGECSAAVAAYGRAANGGDARMTPQLARFVLWSEWLGLRALDPRVRLAMSEVADSGAPTQSELRLHYVAQECDPDDIHPWIGAVSLETVADITRVR